ncbi:MAG: hypothetical protein GXY15_05185 [Candidatus Hydrogenedentes bacterium]|nr:hypothetical protein [Candidatus Hydrogenedentota bacterium]
MDQLKRLIAEKEAEVDASLQKIVRCGALILLGEASSPVPTEITRLFLSSIRIGMNMQVGDLSLMRAVPALDEDGNILKWRLRIRWALPWWDDSYTKDHHRIEVDTWAFAIDGNPHLFVGALSGTNTAVILQGFPNPDDDEIDIVTNYKAWMKHRKKNAARFKELDAQILAHENEVMRSHDSMRDGADTP